MKKLITLICLLAYCIVSYSQINHIASQTYNSLSTQPQDQANFILPTTDGGYLLVGSTKPTAGVSDGQIIKTDGDGNELWKRSRGGAFPDVFYAAVELSGSYYIVGSLGTGFGTYSTEVWLVKYNASNGAFQGEVSHLPLGNPAAGLTIEKTYDSNLVIGGYSRNSSTSEPLTDGLYFAANQNLNIIANSTGIFGNKIGKVTQAADGQSYYFFGVQFQPNDNWCEEPMFVIPDNGLSEPVSAGKDDVLVGKFNNSLSLIWSEQFGGVTPDEFIDGIATSDGGFAILAETGCAGFPGDIGYENICLQNGTFNPYWVLKGNGAGNVQWFKNAPTANSIEDKITPFGILESCEPGTILVGSRREVFAVDPCSYRIDAVSQFNPTTLLSSFSYPTGNTCSHLYIDIERGHNQEIVYAGAFDNLLFETRFLLARFTPEEGCETDCPDPDFYYNCGNIVYTNQNSDYSYDFICPVPNFATGNNWLLNNESIAGTGTPTEEITFPGSGNYTICYPYYDNDGCLQYCCDNYCVELPSASEANIEYQYNSITDEMELTFTAPNATDIDWYSYNPNYQNYNENSPYLYIPVAGNCYDLKVYVRYFDTNDNCWRTCSRTIWVCNPYDCDLISSNPIPEIGYELSLNNPNAQNISWFDDETNQPLGSGANLTIPYPSGNCEYRYISARYFDGIGWRICCYVIFVCDPYDCDLISSNPIPEIGYELSLNTPNAQNISWFDDETNQPLGSGTNLTIPYPSGNCEYRYISARYFDGIGWRICCYVIFVCEPYDCDLISSNPIPEIGYELSLNDPDAQNISWFDDETNQPLGSGTNLTIPYPSGNCEYRYISARYFDGIGWRICCYVIFICDPYDCDAITYEPIPEVGYEFTLNNMNAQNISWYDDATGTLLWEGPDFTLTPLPGECRYRYISARYFDGIGWRVCCYILYVCTPTEDSCFDPCDGWVLAELDALDNYECTLSPEVSTFDYLVKRGSYFGQPVVIFSGTCSVGGDAITETITKVFTCSGELLESCQSLIGNTTCSVGDGSIGNNVENMETVYYPTGNLPPCQRDSIDYAPDTLDACHETSILISGFFPNQCYSIGNFSHTINGNLVEVFIETNTINGSCAQVITPWSVTVQAGILPAGAYEVIVYRDNAPVASSVFTVIPCCELPTALFSYFSNGNEYAFQEASTGQVDTYYWDFGNGTTSSLPNPSIIYETSGTYTVCLTVTNDCGSDQYCEDIFWQDPAELVGFIVADSLCGTPGDLIEIPITVNNFEDMRSFQFTFQVNDTSIAKIVDVTFENLPGTSGANISEELTGVTWYTGVPLTLPHGTTVMKLIVELKNNGTGCSLININGILIPIQIVQQIGGQGQEVTPLLTAGNVCICSTASICGTILREDGAPIEQVEITLIDGSGTILNTTTDNAGHYCFDDLDIGKDFTIIPIKDINYTNGVNAGDLSKINRHVLLLELLDSPYKRIAANADLPNTINAGDLSELQQLILGIITDLPDMNSWRFVMSSYIFPNPDNPFAESFPEVMTINGLGGDINDADFTGMKIGDVNLDNNPNQASDNEAHQRNSGLILWAETNTAIPGDTATLSIKAADFEELYALQFSLNWDSTKLKYIGYTDDHPALNLQSHNFNQTAGAASMIWFSALPLDLPDSTTLFEYKFEVLGMDGDSTSIRFTDQPVPAYAESADGAIGIMADSTWMYFNETVSNVSIPEKTNQITIVPNPTRETFTLSFTSEHNYNLEQVDIYSIYGMRIKSWINISKGFKFDVSDLSAGTHLIVIHTDEQKLIKKLILID